jgi:putative DNA primase/helicase
VIRNVEVNGEHKPRRFSTWAPKAIATIRSLADTLQDRGVVIPLQRKPKTAKVARLRYRDNDEFAALRSRAARWAQDNFSKLADQDPKIPDALNDRAADNWRPLLAIAELAGQRWAVRAQQAALALSGEESNDDDLGVEILKDIAAVFARRNVDAVFTKILLPELVADMERPWGAYGKDRKPITDRQVARLLKPFGIISKTVRVGEATAKGYERVWFDEAFAAYVSVPCATQDLAFYPSQRHNADGTGTSGVFPSVTKEECDGYEKCEKPITTGIVTL